MFDLGTKIILLASSCHKKTGPRKNSIGYVTPLESFKTTFNGCLDKKSKPINVFATLASVKFLYYGNEKRARFETKQTLLVFPMIQSGSNVEATLKAFMNMVSSEKYKNSWDRVREEMSTPDSAPVAIAAPIYTPGVSLKKRVDGDKTYEKELSCWLESVLLSPQISNFINRAIVSRHPIRDGAQGITMQSLSTLREMMLSKEIRRGFIKDMCKISSVHNTLIKTMRMVAIIAKQAEHRTITKNFREVGATRAYNKDSNGGIVASDAYKILVRYLFYDKFDTFKNILVIRRGFPKSIKEMEDTKKVILKLLTTTK